MSTNIRRPYEWGSVVMWSMSLFLLGLTTARPTTHGSLDRFALGMLSGIAMAVLGGVVVAVIKYYKRSPTLETNAALAAAKVYDRAICVGALVVAAILVGKAVYLETYGGLIDAAIIGGLGLGVQRGVSAARWLMAAYAFVTPFIIIAIGGGNAVVWPFVFYAACRSIMAHQHVAYPVTLTKEHGISTRNSTSPLHVATPTAGHKASVAQEPIRSTHTTEVPSEELWSQAMAELEGGTRRPGLWAKAFSEAGGNEGAAKANYLRDRVRQLTEAASTKMVEARRSETVVASSQPMKNSSAAGIISTITATLVVLWIVTLVAMIGWAFLA